MQESVCVLISIEINEVYKDNPRQVPQPDLPGSPFIHLRPEFGVALESQFPNKPDDRRIADPDGLRQSGGGLKADGVEMRQNIFRDISVCPRQGHTLYPFS